jgi:hypothetical protein
MGLTFEACSCFFGSGHVESIPLQSMTPREHRASQARAEGHMLGILRVAPSLAGPSSSSQGPHREDEV